MMASIIWWLFCGDRLLLAVVLPVAFQLEVIFFGVFPSLSVVSTSQSYHSIYLTCFKIGHSYQTDIKDASV